MTRDEREVELDVRGDTEHEPYRNAERVMPGFGVALDARLEPQLEPASAGEGEAVDAGELQRGADRHPGVAERDRGGHGKTEADTALHASDLVVTHVRRRP